MAFQSQIAGSQIDGERDYQEDAFLITHLENTNNKPCALLIVADGMGGHAAGNVASNMAVQAFNKHFSENHLNDDIAEVLSLGISKANSALTDTIKETSALHGMGCTIVSAFIQDTELWWASVGDSHLYLLRNKKLQKLNADHSYGGFLDRMEAAGTPVKPEKGLSRNMLMSALTGDDIPEIDCPFQPFTLQHDDRLILCSDGMDTLSEGKIVQYISWSETPKECSKALLDAVEEEGSPKQDNTTVVAVMIIDDALATTGNVEVEVEVDNNDITEPNAGEDKARQQIPLQQDTQSADGVGKKSRWRLVAGIVIIFSLIGLGVGGYFMVDKGIITKVTSSASSLVDKGKSSVSSLSSSLSTVTEPSTEAEVAEDTPAVAVTQPAPATTEAEVAEDTPAVAVTPKPAATTKQEFQDTLKVGGKSPLMVMVPAGVFQMGSSASSRFAEERPRHEVTISSFAVSKYEVSFAEYEQFAKATSVAMPKGNSASRKTYPITNVKWDDAYKYARWLSKQSGKKYRLLSESEWEYMASTAKRSSFWWGYEPGVGNAHCFGCESGLDPRSAASVGKFDANTFGIHDTAGNVSEWVKDCWHDDYEDAPDTNDVWEGGDCKYRVVRGGAFSSPPQSLRSAKRDKLLADYVYEHVGIRVARDLD